MADEEENLVDNNENYNLINNINKAVMGPKGSGI